MISFSGQLNATTNARRCASLQYFEGIVFVGIRSSRSRFELDESGVSEPSRSMLAWTQGGQSTRASELAVFLPLCLRVSRTLSLYLCISVSLSICLSVSLPLCLSVSLSPLPLCFPVSLSQCFPVALSLCVPVSLFSDSVSLSIRLLIRLFVCPFLYPSVSKCHLWVCSFCRISGYV